MATLTAWQYLTPLGARAGAVRLRMLEDREALEVLDAVTVTWVQGAHQPRISLVRPRMPSPVGDYSVLATLLRRLAPDGTPDASRAVLTSLAEVLDDTGVTRGFLVDMVEHLAPGRSMLLVLSGTADPESVRPVVERGLARGGVTLLYADVPDDAAARLGRVLGTRWD